MVTPQTLERLACAALASIGRPFASGHGPGVSPSRLHGRLAAGRSGRARSAPRLDRWTFHVAAHRPAGADIGRFPRWLDRRPFRPASEAPFSRYMDRRAAHTDSQHTPPGP
jgi:hypothetical protein